MKNRKGAICAVIGALALVAVACTPSPPRPVEDRVNRLHVSDAIGIVDQVVSDTTTPVSGFIVNTPTSSFADVTMEQFGYDLTLSVGCVGPQTWVSAQRVCSAAGIFVMSGAGIGGTLPFTVSGSLTTIGVEGSVTAMFDGIIPGAGLTLRTDLYDGQPS